MKFTKSTNAKKQDDAITFELELEGVVRPFEISGDVLRQRFDATDASGSELLHAFEAGADEITEAARRVRSVPTDGPIELGEGDF